MDDDQVRGGGKGAAVAKIKLKAGYGVRVYVRQEWIFAVVVSNNRSIRKFLKNVCPKKKKQ